MRIHLIAVGTRLPGWAETACRDYARRLPSACSVAIVPIAPAKHRRSRAGSAAAADYRTEEAGRILNAVPPGAAVVALDAQGETLSSPDLAGELGRWMARGQDVALLIGGPDGLGPSCLERAERRWSLSRLTLPHALARVVTLEQIYRAWSILSRHPYHRA